MFAADLIFAWLQRHGHADAANAAFNAWEQGEMVEAVTPAADEPELPLSPTDAASVARQMGFTGDSCDTCGSMRMKVAGHCTVCEDCGTTTGCS